jgi:hypothetical protein
MCIHYTTLNFPYMPFILVMTHQSEHLLQLPYIWKVLGLIFLSLLLLAEVFLSGTCNMKKRKTFHKFLKPLVRLYEWFGRRFFESFHMSTRITFILTFQILSMFILKMCPHHSILYLIYL